MKETQNIEFKQRWRDDFLAELCGFANAQGGTLYIGVDDNGKVVGVENAKQLLEKLPNLINQTMGLLATINLLTDDGKEYISVSVPATERPVSFRGKYYFRSGTTLQEMNGNTLHSFLLQKMNLSWDATTQPSASLEDIDRDAVDYFMYRAIEAKRINPDSRNDSTQKILQNLQLIDEHGKLTMAALLLFGKDIERWNLNAIFRIGRFRASRADLIIQDNISCPLIMMPDNVVSTLRAKYLVSPIHYEGLLRKEPLEIPEDGLREIICNAIVHKDYTGTFIQMRVWDDRVELWNSGTLPEGYTIETLMGDHESRPRNTLIAKAFYLSGFIEAWGRGYEKIRKSFEREHLQTPNFEQIRGGMMATIQRERFVAISNRTSQNDIAGKFDGSSNSQQNEPLNDSLNTIHLSENQSKVYTFIKLMAHNNDTLNDSLDEPLNTAYISTRLAMPYSTTKRIVKFLEQNNLIRRVGSKKTGHWEVTVK